MKNSRKFIILGILIATVLIMGIVLNITLKSDQNTKKDDIRDVELRKSLHERLTNDLTLLTDGYILIANKKGRTKEMITMSSEIQLSEYDYFSVIRSLINIYSFKRDDIKVMTPWTREGNDYHYQLGLTSELVYVYLIIYDPDTNKITIISTINK